MMLGLELRREALLYARNRTAGVTDRMVKLRIPRNLCGELSLGLVQAAVHDREWEPADNALTAITVPIWANDGAIDILALDPNNESKWWHRSDLASVIDYIEIQRAAFFKEPLLIHATPFAWLRAGATGTVILDWHANVEFWLSGVHRLLCHDVHTARRLDRALKSPPPKFEIKLAKEPFDVAA